jgi:2-haloacid dehalogenase
MAGPEALVFDMYGTLVDPIRIWTRLEQYVPDKALGYALAAAGHELTAEQKDALMAQYDDLERFPDVEPGLIRLQQLGHTMIVFSNGSPRMLDAIMDAAGLRPYFEGYVSVDEV